MGVQIINYGAIIRIDTDGNVLLLSKSQVRDIEIVHNDTVRINLGEGVLREVLVKLSDVTHPAGLPDVAALRDHISHFLDYANKYELEAISVSQEQLAELNAIKQLMQFYHGSWQTLWNYQQTQINMLLAIENVLHSNKALTQEIISNQILQTLEQKNIATKVEAGNTFLQEIQDLSTQSVAKQEEQIGNLNSIKGFSEQSLGKAQEQVGLLEDLNSLSQESLGKAQQQIDVLASHTSLFATIESHLQASYGVQNSSNSNIADMRDKMFQLQVDSTAKVNLLTHMKDALFDVIGHMAAHSGQFTAMNSALQDIKTLLANP